MKLKLTLGIVVSALAFGSGAAEARPIHPHHHRARREPGRLEAPPSGALRGLIASTAAKDGVPYRLANAVVTIESRYDPYISNGGALGLMQIKAQTARGLGFRGAAASLFDPYVNVRYGMAYLALAYRQSGGDLCATVMRYQSGIGATRMSAANRAYCTRAHALMARA
jgi:soluble lytic murein transglycosylase-like protein